MPEKETVMSARLKRVRYLFARLLDVLDLPGNDGLTKTERTAYAEDYRRHVMRPLSDAEMNAYRAMKERQR